MKKSNQIMFVVIATVIVVIFGGAIFLINRPTTKASSSAATDAIATNTVTVQNYAFAPKAIKVKVGATVTWTNQDDVSHTVTADQPSPDGPSSPSFARGETFSFTFNKAGTYAYHCNPHPYMHGSVIVTN